MRISGWRFKALLGSILLAAGGYLVLSLASGWQSVANATTRVGASGIVILLCMSSANYLLRSTRWAAYLHRQGYGHLSVVDNLRIYVAGFALTTTPGKAGEAVRSVFLARRGVPYAVSLAAMFSERFSDLVAVLLLCSVGLDLYPALRVAVLLLAVCASGVLLLLSRQAWLPALERQATGLRGRTAKAACHLLRLLRQIHVCHAGWIVWPTLLMSCAAWGAEGLGFAWLSHWLGIGIGTRYAVFVYAASMLAGAVSVMPGGLGGAEAAMIMLLRIAGADSAQAVAATILIRLATLWFAVVLGMIVMLPLRREPGPSPE